jgi:hypothetical protein
MKLVFKREVTVVPWTFIFGFDGRIAYKNPKADPAKGSKQIEALLKELEKK